MARPRALHLTSGEAQYLAELLGPPVSDGSKAANSIMTKLEHATAPRTVESAGDVIRGAVTALETVLGPVLLPEHPTGEWFARTANYIRSRGYTNEAFARAAAGAAGWRRPVLFEKVVWNMDRLLAAKTGDTYRVRTTAPAPMEDL